VSQQFFNAKTLRPYWAVLCSNDAANHAHEQCVWSPVTIVLAGTYREDYKVLSSQVSSQAVNGMMSQQYLGHPLWIFKLYMMPVYFLVAPFVGCLGWGTMKFILIWLLDMYYGTWCSTPI
jgi:hypothetical protein